MLNFKLKFAELCCKSNRLTKNNMKLKLNNLKLIKQKYVGANLQTNHLIGV